MATIQPTRANTDTHESMIFTWASMALGDDGSPYPFSNFADRSVQVFGTFGVGGALTVEGSNDGVNWATLHDISGNALVLTAAGLLMVAEVTRFIRPRVTAGDGTTALTVCMLVRTTR